MQRAYYMFDVNEAYARLLLTDVEGSSGGCTYSPTYHRLRGIQKVGFTSNKPLVSLLGDGGVIGNEGSVEGVDLDIEHGKLDQLTKQIIHGGFHWQEPGVSVYEYTEDSSTINVELIVRVPKVGISGADLKLTFRKVNFGSDGRDATGKAFGGNKLTAKAALTDSLYPVYDTATGMLVYRRSVYREELRAAGAALVAASGDTTAPTVTASTPTNAATGQAVTVKPEVTLSEDLLESTVNPFTVLLKKHSDGSLVTASKIELTNAGSSTKIKFWPAADLEAATQYDYVITTTVADKNGNTIASEVTKTFTTT